MGSEKEKQQQTGGCQRWGWGVGKICEGGQNVYISSYKKSKFCDVMYIMVNIVVNLINSVVYLKATKRGNLFFLAK